ncbi:MAG: hypothetical protein A2W03_18660 [Candidatus Aminicenantes bacterium RBG_16_63_16]|nr:MAG: hypothetical protein A2W03_18660 [Candidatus Aminicenantes bacterium RBG_16_63_16]
MSPEGPDSDELEKILAEFHGSIKSSVLKFGLAERGVDPEDVLQEIRVKLWKGIAGEKKIHSRASYIKSVVNSTLIDCLRRSRREAKLIQHELEKQRLESQGRRPEILDSHAHRELVGEAAESLMDSRRRVVKMFLLDMTLEEISRSLEWSPDKVRNLLYRGLSDLRNLLREKGIDYENR